jgi:hypothetical protein
MTWWIIGGVLLLGLIGYLQGLIKNTPRHHWSEDGNYEADIVGESKYQSALANLAGSHNEEGANTKHVALLFPEDDNPHDSKAIRVDIQGCTVGYLSREDARTFRRRLSKMGFEGRPTTCDALIVGGFTRRNGEKCYYGVKLDIKGFD